VADKCQQKWGQFATDKVFAETLSVCEFEYAMPSEQQMSALGAQSGWPAMKG
jgi:hypothetical protein